MFSNKFCVFGPENITIQAENKVGDLGLGSSTQLKNTENTLQKHHMIPEKPVLFPRIAIVYAQITRNEPP